MSAYLSPKLSEVVQRHAKVQKMANEMETDNSADVQPFQLPTSLSMLVSSMWLLSAV